MMKTIARNRPTALFFIALCTIVMACGKDTPNPEPRPEELIIGKWYIDKITKADGSANEPANDCEKDSYYRFDDQNEINVANSYLVDDECITSFGGGEYLLADNGKKLVVTASDGVLSTINILKLNRLSLELNYAGDTMHLKKRN